MVRAYLMSFVARQALLLKEQLPARYPHAWLVWEPGSWSAPPVQGDHSATRLPTSHSAVTAPQRGDALCFELDLPAKATGLHLGRASTNDIVINDATVSREHLLFTKSATGKWSAEALGASKSTFLGSMPLAAGQKVALSDEERIKVGDVVFTFHEPRSFFVRLTTAVDAIR
jgi:hypothetical protein